MNTLTTLLLLLITTTICTVRYQCALKKCKEIMRNNEEVVVRFEFEPDNEDRNAIRFDACIDGLWHPLGYAGLPKIPKLTKAIRMNEIQSISLSVHFQSWYVHQQDKIMITGLFTIVKSSPWWNPYHVLAGMTDQL